MFLCGNIPFISSRVEIRFLLEYSSLRVILGGGIWIFAGCTAIYVLLVEALYRICSKRCIERIRDLEPWWLALPPLALFLFVFAAAPYFAGPSMEDPLENLIPMSRPLHGVGCIPNSFNM